jgi:RNA polymerase sigma factor for flagellar operon FliA
VKPADSALRDQLVLEHLPQVTLVVRRIREQLPAPVSIDDLISTGTAGLIQAIDQYDERRDLDLKTYAEHKIRGAILASLRGEEWESRQERKLAKQIEEAISDLEKENRRTPTEEEITTRLGLTVSEYQDRLNELRGVAPGSWENVGTQERGNDLLRYLADADEHSPSQIVERASLERLLAQAIAKMPPLERTVLSLYYYEEMTLSEIAPIVDLDESRTSHLKVQAILRLRSYLSEKGGEITLTQTLIRLPEFSAGEDASEITEENQPVSALMEDPVVQILMAAAAAFQKPETGRSWLLTPSPSLGNVTPASLISTKAGREMVANELGLIEHGMF